jgi:cytochrome c biogenesis protein CcmG, thiol:disulfide interchange protein DsbE
VRCRLLIAAVLVAGASACSGSSAIHPGPSELTGPTYEKLVAAAHLTRCPTSASTSVPGGLPNVTLPCLGHGPAVHLAGLTGQPMVVNVWGSWCEPCQAEEQYLAAAYDKDHAKVGFLGDDIVDQADSALDFDAHVTPPVHFPSVFDVDRKASIALHVISPPYTVFVSRTGQIVHTHHGGYTSTAQIQADIATYLHVAA